MDILQNLESVRDSYVNESNLLNTLLGNLNGDRATMVEKMYPFFLVFGIILLIAAAFLIVAIIIQSNRSGSNKGIGAITGSSSDTHWGRQKGKSIDKKLSTLTIAVAIFFIVCVIAVYILQTDLSDIESNINSVENDIYYVEQDIKEADSKINSVLSGDDTTTGGLVSDPENSTDDSSASGSGTLENDPEA